MPISGCVNANGLFMVSDTADFIIPALSVGGEGGYPLRGNYGKSFCCLKNFFRDKTDVNCGEAIRWGSPRGTPLGKQSGWGNWVILLAKDIYPDIACCRIFDCERECFSGGS